MHSTMQNVTDFLQLHCLYMHNKAKENAEKLKLKVEL